MAKKVKKVTTTTTVTEETEVVSGHRHVEFLVDRSGSMSPTWDDTIGALNEFARGVAASFPEATIGVSFFDSAMEYGSNKGTNFVSETTVEVKDWVDISSKKKSIMPRGSTPLFDAVGITANKLLKRDESEIVNLVILTDGMENASTEFKTPEAVAAVVEQLKKREWLVTFLGADISAWSQYGGLGINAGSATVVKLGDFKHSVGAVVGQSTRYMDTRSVAAAAYTSEERARLSGER